MKSVWSEIDERELGEMLIELNPRSHPILPTYLQKAPQLEGQMVDALRRALTFNFKIGRAFRDLQAEFGAAGLGWIDSSDALEVAGNADHRGLQEIRHVVQGVVLDKHQDDAHLNGVIGDLERAALFSGLGDRDNATRCLSDSKITFEAHEAEWSEISEAFSEPETMQLDAVSRSH
jgi:hypothetical protein